MSIQKLFSTTFQTVIENFVWKYESNSSTYCMVRNEWNPYFIVKPWSHPFNLYNFFLFIVKVRDNTGISTMNSKGNGGFSRGLIHNNRTAEGQDQAEGGPGGQDLPPFRSRSRKSRDKSNDQSFLHKWGTAQT